MKIIFLDVDGVLNNESTTESCRFYTGIDPVCLSRLKNLVDVSGAKIVLTSTWKTNWHKDDKSKQDEFADYLDRKFAEVGLTIFDKTQDEIDGEPIERGESVIEYLLNVKYERFVILDDCIFDFYECNLGAYLVRTDEKVGLTERNTMRAAMILGLKDPEREE